ncbi:MAG: GNAT family N-acetyltransferase [Rikenellaceae bacterium]
MDVIHDVSRHRFVVEIDGLQCYAGYEIGGDSLCVVSTFVPKALEGRGIASALVGACNDYAKSQGLICNATCSYAVAWLTRHR